MNENYTVKYRSYNCVSRIIRNKLFKISLVPNRLTDCKVNMSLNGSIINIPLNGPVWDMGLPFSPLTLYRCVGLALCEGNLVGRM